MSRMTYLNAAYARFGGGVYGGDTEILIILSCGTLQHCTWLMDGWENAAEGGRFNTVNGYHGIETFGPTDNATLGDYVEGAEFNGVGDDWVDLMTTILEDEWDDCARSIIWGNTRTLRSNIYYYQGFKDFKDPISHVYNSYWKILNCIPDGN